MFQTAYCVSHYKHPIIETVLFSSILFLNSGIMSYLHWTLSSSGIDNTTPYLLQSIIQYPLSSHKVPLQGLKGTLHLGQPITNGDGVLGGGIVHHGVAEGDERVEKGLLLSDFIL